MNKPCDSIAEAIDCALNQFFHDLDGEVSTGVYDMVLARVEKPLLITVLGRADGNQTRIRTSTGIWEVSYDANDRPVVFASQDGRTTITCGYDYQGRRYMKKVTVNGTVTSHERYLYRGYLQLAALDMLNRRNVLRTLLWDPLEPVATRPLALVQATYSTEDGRELRVLRTAVDTGGEDGVTHNAYSWFRRQIGRAHV